MLVNTGVIEDLVNNYCGSKKLLFGSGLPNYSPLEFLRWCCTLRWIPFTRRIFCMQTGNAFKEVSVMTIRDEAYMGKPISAFIVDAHTHVGPYYSGGWYEARPKPRTKQLWRLWTGSVSTALLRHHTLL